MNTRSKIIATIGVLWLAAFTVIAVQTWNDTERVDGKELTRTEYFQDCIRRVDGNEETRRLVCELVLSQSPMGVPLYEQIDRHDFSGAKTPTATISLIALVIIGATIIWTRPKDDEQVAATTPNSGPPTPKPKASQTLAPAVETVASSAADPASALRQLKALHDEGILTDDEYETKRKALTDQL